MTAPGPAVRPEESAPKLCARCFHHEDFHTYLEDGAEVHAECAICDCPALQRRKAVNA